MDETDYTKLTEKNMEEFSKLSNAIADYIQFLREERHIPNKMIRELLQSTVEDTFLQNLGGE